MDVTSTVAHLYNLGTTEWTCASSTFNDVDPLPDVVKSCTVVYEICQNAAVLAVEEDSTVSIP